MNITSLKRPYTTTSLLILLNTVSLGSYYAHGKEALTQDIDSDRAAKKGYREIGRMNLQLSPIKGHSTGEG